MEISN